MPSPTVVNRSVFKGENQM